MEHGRKRELTFHCGEGTPSPLPCKYESVSGAQSYEDARLRARGWATGWAGDLEQRPTGSKEPNLWPYLRTGHRSKCKTPEAGRNVERARDRRTSKVRVAGEESWEARSESRSGVWGLHGRGLRPASEQDSHEEVLCGERRKCRQATRKAGARAPGVPRSSEVRPVHTRT